MVAESLKGDALRWYKVESRVGFTDWLEFKRRLVARFAQLMTCSSLKRVRFQARELIIRKKCCKRLNHHVWNYLMRKILKRVQRCLRSERIYQSLLF